MPVRLPWDRTPTGSGSDGTGRPVAPSTRSCGPTAGSIHPLDADPNGIFGAALVHDVAPADRADRRVTAPNLDGRRRSGRDVGVGRAAGPADSISRHRGLTIRRRIREEGVGRPGWVRRVNVATPRSTTVSRPALAVRRRSQHGDRHWFPTGPHERILVEVADRDPGDDERHACWPDREARRQTAVGAAPRPQAVAVRGGLLRLHHPPAGQLPRAGATRGELVMTVGKRQE